MKPPEGWEGPGTDAPEVPEVPCRSINQSINQSQNIKSKFASYLFKHKDFAGNIKAALTDVIARCEAEILRGNDLTTTYQYTLHFY